MNPGLAGVEKIRTIYGSNSVSLIAISRVGATALTLLSAPIIARSIGPEGRGETATALAAFALVPIIISLGIPLEIRRASVKGDDKPIIRSARDICLVLFVPAGALSALLCYFIFASMPRSVVFVAALGVLAAPITVSWLCDQSVLIARENYRGVAAIQLCQPVVYVSLIFGAMALDRISVAFVLSANLAGTLAASILGLWLCRASVRGRRTSRWSVLRAGVRYSGSAIAEAASNRFDQLLILPLIGAYGAGLYSIAVTISSIPLSVGHALGAHFFNTSARASEALLGSVSSFAIRAGLIASGAFSLVLCAVAPVLVPLVFGEEFGASTPAVLISLLGSVAMTTAYVGSMVLAAQGKGSLMTIAQLMSLTTGLIGLYSLAPHLGVVGASIASAVGYFVLLVVVICALRVRMRGLIPRADDVRSVVAILR